MPTTYGRTAPKEFAPTIRKKAAVLWWLAEHGGTLESGSGVATSELADAITPLVRAGERTGLAAFSGLLTALENDGLVIRDVRGRRVFSVALVPTADELRKHPRYGRNPWPHTNGQPKPEPVATIADEPLDGSTQDVGPVEPHASTVNAALRAEVVNEQPDLFADWTPPPAPTPNADPHTLLGLAMSYIAQAVATSRPIERTDPQVLQRLASTLDDNQRLRTKLAVAEDTAHALRDEVTGLRKVKAMLEDNVRTIAAGRLDEGALRRFRELERFMQAPPNAKL